MVDEGDVQRCVGVDGDEERAGIPGERQRRAGWGRGLKVVRRHGAGEIQLGEENLARKLLGARDDEHVREVVSEQSRESGVVRCREGGSAGAGAEVGVVASFVGKDAACRLKQNQIIGQERCSSDVLE